MASKLRQYALQILRDHNCDVYTYGTTPGEDILRDLMMAYPNGMQYPYIRVVNAIIAVSKRRPFKRSPWRVLWDSAHCTDSFACATLAEAKRRTLELHESWLEDARSEFSDPEHPTEDEVERFNQMLYDNSASVEKYNPETDEYDEYWFPSEKDLTKIGWVLYGEEE